GVAVAAGRSFTFYRACAACIARASVGVADVASLSCHCVSVTITTDRRMTAYRACTLTITSGCVGPADGFALLSGCGVFVSVTTYRELALRSHRHRRCIIAVTHGGIAASKVVALLARRGIGISIPTRWRSAATGTITTIIITVARHCIDATRVVTLLRGFPSARRELDVHIAIATQGRMTAYGARILAIACRGIDASALALLPGGGVDVIVAA